jgi:hypothetical protein
MFFGAGGWISGCQTIAEYREPADAIERQVDLLPSAQDRDAARESFARYAAVLDAAKKREFPIGVAEFLLGAALLALTIRAIAGRSGARSMLVQVAAAQAALVLIAYFMTADVRNAWIAHNGLTGHLMAPPDSMERAMWHPGMLSAFFGAMWSSWIGMRTLLTVVAIVALTRQRTREFFEASTPVSQR